MSGAFRKVTTGLTGLAVVEQPHRVLTVLYEKTLRVLQKMPEDAAYRKHTTSVIQERLGVVKSQPDVQKVEASLQSGQIEEVIQQAERELTLSRRMLEWKPWEPLVEQAPKNQWKWPI